VTEDAKQWLAEVEEIRKAITGKTVADVAWPAIRADGTAYQLRITFTDGTFLDLAPHRESDLLIDIGKL